MRDEIRPPRPMDEYGAGHAGEPNRGEAQAKAQATASQQAGPVYSHRLGDAILCQAVAAQRRRLEALEHLRRSLPDAFWDHPLATEALLALAR